MCRWWLVCIFLDWLDFWQPIQLLGARLGLPDFPPNLPEEDAENNIFLSFNKLLDDAPDSKDLSRFSDELAVSVLSVLHNLSASFVREKVSVEVDAASRNVLVDNPDTDRCFSRDYSELCPVGWYELGDGKSCKATYEYKGSCEPTADFSGATPLSKQSFARRCDVSWPCRNACEEDYSNMGGSSMPCPNNWSNEAGLCKAPASYRGNCVLEKHFFGFDEPSKARWAEACNVKWPCKGYDFDYSTSRCPVAWSLSVDGDTCEAPPSYTGPCDVTLRIGVLSNEEKARIAATCELKWPVNFCSRYDFTAPCPMGWSVVTSSQQFPECQPPEGYFGRCMKVQRFASMTDDKRCEFMLRCSAAWPVKDVAERNYAAPCPSRWHLESKETGICAALNYNGPCQTRFNFNNYDTEMKKAFEGRCKAFFPISAFSATPKLQPLMLSTPLHRSATGPIGPAATKYHGKVVPPDGTIYLPSRTNSSQPFLSHTPPKPPDSTASRASSTATHIKKLEEIKNAVADPRLGSLITDAIEELATQGGEAELHLL